MQDHLRLRNLGASGNHAFPLRLAVIQPVVAAHLNTDAHGSELASHPALGSVAAVVISCD